MVKPAADQSNGKAMITMGALYATGHCVTRDLPTAYRYFALALRKDPENAALKQNAEMVWGQMTQSERQQAIRLTQEGIFAGFGGDFAALLRWCCSVIGLLTPGESQCKSPRAPCEPSLLSGIAGCTHYDGRQAWQPARYGSNPG